MKRCDWCGEDSLYIKYHDEEWGVPTYDDRKLFEFLVLESAQAGLSWITILRRRDGYRKAYDHFDYKKVSMYDQEKITNLMQDSGIIRNRKKIEASINNAKQFIKVQKEYGSFSDYLWAFTDHKPLDNSWSEINNIPAKTDLSIKISKDLKKRGFQFLGPTIVYAYMQAVGLVNDHITSCFRHREV